MNILKWFTQSWWRYLLGPMKVRYDDEWFWRLKVIACRARGHPYGVVWFTQELEPDMTCKNCGEDLG